MLYAENSIQEMKKEDIVNKLSSNPLYEQVFNRIKDSVRSGEYKKGDLIPSEKELMELMGVSRVTVRQALKMLSDSGIIETRKGKGVQAVRFRNKVTGWKDGHFTTVYDDGICLNSLHWPDVLSSLLLQSRRPSWQQSRISVSWNMHSSMILRLQSRQSRLSGSGREPVFSPSTAVWGKS